MSNASPDQRQDCFVHTVTVWSPSLSSVSLRFALYVRTLSCDFYLMPCNIIIHVMQDAIALTGHGGP
jgi:hypothetical protein